MVSLVLMYVYYDDNGDIKAITPLPEDELASVFSLAMFPIADVETFLSGKSNPFNYSVKKINKLKGEVYKIVKKQSNDIVITRTLDNYLTKVDPASEETILKIVVDPAQYKIFIRLDNEFRDLRKFGDDEQKDDVEAFVNNASSSIYFTKLNDPYCLLHQVTFTPKDLFDNAEIVYEYNDYIDLSNSSVYTKKILKNYGYYIRGKRNVV